MRRAHGDACEHDARALPVRQVANRRELLLAREPEAPEERACILHLAQLLASRERTTHPLDARQTHVHLLIHVLRTENRNTCRTLLL